VSGTKLYVGNLSYSTSEEALKEAFGVHGEVTSVALITDRDTGRPRGFGFVEMGTQEEAAAAQGAMDGAQLDGRTIKVDFAREREPRRTGGGGYGGGGGGGYGGGGGGGYGGGRGGGGYSGGGSGW
jgi:RNA recognition motif-containing protein